MNNDGTPKPSGKALHNLTTLLRDSGPKSTSFTPGTLDYTLSGTQDGDNSLLLQKSDGSYWLALWNESAVAHQVTVTLPSTASKITTYDPLASTAGTRSVTNSATITTTVPDHPILLQIVKPKK